MKSYLGLIPISAKVRRRRNRMTILCIVFAVFLVTAIFSVADMVIRTENSRMLSKHGNWHIKLSHVPENIAQEIAGRPDIAAAGVCSVWNAKGEQPYRAGEKRAVLYGADKTYMSEIADGIVEGAFPQSDHEVMLSPNAALALGAQPGGSITLRTPAGEYTFAVSGFGTDDKSYYEDQTYLVGVYMTETAFASLMAQNGVADSSPSYYLQFQSASKAAKAITEIRSQYSLPEESVLENTGVMSMSGLSSHASMMNFYGIAVILFVLVLLSGVLMISGSMNSNIAGRTQFFGMMRCIGASREQIIRFVRLEALNLCKTAVPLGLIMGTLVSWGICAALRCGIGGEYAATPIFEVSAVGLISGAVVGIATVILAAQAPAKRASRVSPMSAVSGNAENSPSVRRAAMTGLGGIDCALGIHHAVASKKNWCLMTASFALSILLFLSFSVILDWAQLLMPSQAPTSADFAFAGYNNAFVLDRALVDRLKAVKGVENAYGSNYRQHVPAVCSRAGVDQISVVSYDGTLLDYAKGSIVQGDLTAIYGDSDKVATVFNKDNPLQLGDTLRLGGAEVEISCALSQGLFGDGVTVICSQETFDRLMGEEAYGLIGVQLGKDATEETAAQIRSFEDGEIVVVDQRETNRRGNATYLASRIVVYGFLTIIGCISLFNILNSISMSVFARTKQYGAMRAVGMDHRQLTRMISAEAITYAVSGLVTGCAAGIPLSRFLYTQMITRHFGIVWRAPVALLLIVIAFVFAAAAVAAHAPCKRICRMPVTETINEL